MVMRKVAPPLSSTVESANLQRPILLPVSLVPKKEFFFPSREATPRVRVPLPSSLFLSDKQKNFPCQPPLIPDVFCFLYESQRTWTRPSRACSRNSLPRFDRRFNKEDPRTNPSTRSLFFDRRDRDAPKEQAPLREVSLTLPPDTLLRARCLVKRNLSVR